MHRVAASENIKRPFAQSLSSVTLTIGVHVITGHLWGGEALLEGVSVVAVVFHGHQLLLLVWS